MSDPSQTFPFLTDAGANAILAALPEGSTRFVGGCIRNALWGLPVADIDMATQLSPQEVQTALKAAKIKTVPTGVSHGTLTAVVSRKPYEITTLRRDVETDGRRAVIAYTQDWAEDAQRRDFTVNALYADAAGEIYDPTGEGLKDIKARRFRFVGDADARVREDYLRILRLFRFVAWYGDDAKITKEALSACRENRRGLKSLSAERVWSETKKLLSAPDPVRSIRIMLQQELLDTLLPEASNVDGLVALIALEAREGIKPDPLLRLMAMMGRDALSAALLAKRLKLSNKEAARIKDWASNAENLSHDMPERAQRQAIYRAGQQVIIDRARLRAAGAEDAIKSTQWMGLADLAMGWTPPTFPVRGADLLSAGVPKGPKLGKALTALEALWVRSGFSTAKPQLLAALKLLGY
ncbi:cytidine(C)-cytidine(C)-adenosine (A)]-adding enzyme [Algimonas arctica]|uniref:Cytidine(C)-cytidine(C)-adenosine (A)]-adding enzyme n=1 Tax=Algimonas arctica TaxID=1479486 RepID=A0A8J3CP87_9PROT|nr:CCA tRNA nucleotidyltransferase [Algimonas arctica]GHA82038.1 cytidine(C)-cytidine(C)-adenosine (A)]-adding enzyme [Algimonas arctica]